VTRRRQRRWHQCWTLAVFEIHQQRKDPLTWLYALVFLLLSVGFASGSGIELVGNRGSIPVSSAWSLWLAFGGLTAFGQVITTMVAVTAVLRDHATRMADVIASTEVSASTWLAARLLAACVVLSLVYLAIPLGAGLGLAVGVARGSESLSAVMAALPRLAAAFLVLTVPTMLVVGTLVGVVAAITKRTMPALFVSLLLVGCWQLALVLVAQPSTQLFGALLDPFGNAPVLVATRDWYEAARRLREISIDDGIDGVIDQVIVLNRLLWLSIGAVGVAVGLWRVDWHTASTGDARDFSDDADRAAWPGPVIAAATSHVVPRPPAYDARRVTIGAARGTARASKWAVSRSLMRFTAHWIARDGGWRAVAGLAAANALLNAALQGSIDVGVPDTLPVFLERVTQHARVFCILLATVYAGEILWRDRDTRVSELVDALPPSTPMMAIARLGGVLWPQGQLVLLIATGALAIGAWRGLAMDMPALKVWLAWSIFHVWAPFTQWTVLSLAVHVIIRHKVGAHLLLITGWVVAFALNQRDAATGWWYRYAEPAPLMDGSGLAWTSLLLRGVAWMGVAAVLTVVVARRWPRGSEWRARAARR